MAKKRTLVPFYGKVNQAMEQRAAMLARAGDQEGATAIFTKERQMRAAKRAAALGL